MKKIILGTLLCCLCYIPLQAQSAGGEFQGRTAERIHAMKVAFITDKLRFTPKESQEFWPLFNQFEKQQHDIRQKYKSHRDVRDMSDEEAEQLILNNFEKEAELLGLKRDYFYEFKKVIPVRKIAMLTRAEREFKEELLKKMRERKQINRQRKRPGFGN